MEEKLPDWAPIDGLIDLAPNEIQITIEIKLGIEIEIEIEI